MKIIKLTSSMLMAAAAFIALPCFAVTVSTVAELTNAVATASAGDTIVITTSLTPSASEFMDQSGMSFLNVTKANLTIMGEDESSRKTWTQGSEPVIINMGEHGRFLNLKGSNLTIKNITITKCKKDGGYGSIANRESGEATFTNCVFRQNSGGVVAFWVYNKFDLRDCAYVSNSTRLTAHAYGCDISGNTARLEFIEAIYDCTISGHNVNNLIDSFIGGAVISGCQFSENIGTIVSCSDTDITISDCKFFSNSFASTGDNAYMLIYKNSNTTKTNNSVLARCTFSNNAASVLNSSALNGKLTVEDCNFIENTAMASGSGISYVKAIIKGNAADADHCMIYDSTFSNNYHYAASGTNLGLINLLGAHAVRCSFVADSNAPASGFNAGWNLYNDTANNSILDDCDIAAGELRGCVLNRCVVHDVTNKVYSVFRDYCRATNTLVKCCSNNLGGLYTPTSAQPFDAQFVNCTIVSNTLLTISAIWDNNSPIVGCSFINCIFNGNRTSTVDSDITISGSNAGSSIGNWTNHVHFSHSYYGKFMESGRLTEQVFAAKTNVVDTLSLCANPKFVKDSRPEAPYWSLSPSSPLIGKGDSLDFSASDLDLAGKLRLKDGMVDPGCYQCWLNPEGLILIFR